MTPQEVIELVEQCGLNIEGIKNIECESVIISALEKQIPKKVIKEEYGACKCPACNDLEVKDYTTGVKFRHCHYCGQALDWSDTE